MRTIIMLLIMMIMIRNGIPALSMINLIKMFSIVTLFSQDTFSYRGLQAGVSLHGDPHGDSVGTNRGLSVSIDEVIKPRTA